MKPTAQQNKSLKSIFGSSSGWITKFGRLYWEHKNTPTNARKYKEMLDKAESNGFKKEKSTQGAPGYIASEFKKGSVSFSASYSDKLSITIDPRVLEENFKPSIKDLIEKTIFEKLSFDQEITNLDEKFELSHARYLRSHGKKARGRGMWMFTSKEMGEPKGDEMVTVSGDLSAAAKEAAKKLDTDRVYVMESVELDENIKNVGDAMLKFLATTGTPHGTYSRQEVKDEHNRRMKWDSIYRKTKALHSKESVELDEAKNNVVARYMNKDGNNVLYFEIWEKPNGNLYSKISNQRGLNVAASAIDLRSSHAAAKKNVERAVMFYDQDGDSGALKHLNSLLPGWKKVPIQESVELDEAKTDVYHKHMLKALGKSRLPKNHSFTSEIATNGDFIVRDGGGRVVGRIPKGEHDLKESFKLTEDVHNDLNDAIIDFQRKLMRMTRQLDPAIAKEVKKLDKDLDALRTGPLFKIRPGR